MGHIGIVLALEVSRLARNNRDWYHLLDLCALVDTLIADADGIYHPSVFNDRLLLGLKGTPTGVLCWTVMPSVHACRAPGVEQIFWAQFAWWRACCHQQSPGNNHRAHPACHGTWHSGQLVLNPARVPVFPAFGAVGPLGTALKANQRLLSAG